MIVLTMVHVVQRCQVVQAVRRWNRCAIPAQQDDEHLETRDEQQHAKEHKEQAGGAVADAPRGAAPGGSSGRVQSLEIGRVQSCVPKYMRGCAENFSFKSKNLKHIKKPTLWGKFPKKSLFFGNQTLYVFLLNFPG